MKVQIKKQLRKTKWQFLTYGWLLLSVFASCDKVSQTLYSDFEETEHTGWLRRQLMEFSPFAEDSTFSGKVKNTDCDLILTLRHNDYLDKREIWVAFEETDREGNVSNDTVKLEMCDARGRWKGRGHRGIYEFEYKVRERYRIPDGYSLSVTHAMLSDTLTGINDVGLTIVRSNKQ